MKVKVMVQRIGLLKAHTPTVLLPFCHLPAPQAHSEVPLLAQPWPQDVGGTQLCCSSALPWIFWSSPPRSPAGPNMSGNFQLLPWMVHTCQQLNTNVILLFTLAFPYKMHLRWRENDCVVGVTVPPLCDRILWWRAHRKGAEEIFGDIYDGWWVSLKGFTFGQLKKLEYQLPTKPLSKPS